MLVPAVVDVDDLISRDQITTWLCPLKAMVPHFKLTAYAVPNRLGPVHQLKEEFPWITFGIHGFEHSFSECLGWTKEQAKTLLQTALDMGYAPVFKAPNWQLDFETEEALKELEIVLHHHLDDYKPTTAGLYAYPGLGPLQPHAYIHTHILRNPVTDFIDGHPGFMPDSLAEHDEFLSPIDLAVML